MQDLTEIFQESGKTLRTDSLLNRSYAVFLECDWRAHLIAEFPSDAHSCSKSSVEAVPRVVGCAGRSTGSETL